MSLTPSCTSFQRTLYIELHDTPVCLVCSSPLLETIKHEDEDRKQALN